MVPYTRGGGGGLKYTPLIFIISYTKIWMITFYLKHIVDPEFGTNEKTHYASKKGSGRSGVSLI